LSAWPIPLPDLPAPAVPATAPSSIAAFVDRSTQLYSLPAVVHEVLALLNEPKLDAVVLKQRIECDPALASKLLRVVNSSLFGLSRKVDNLTQAIALLGTRPLKLLVLGFSLPPELENGLTREQLASYWRISLTRAITAKRLAQQYFHLDPDDTFIAALVADIGKLVLYKQLGGSYAQLVHQTQQARGDLATQTRQSLGFDHHQLAASLLRSWQLPDSMSAAIEQMSGVLPDQRDTWPASDLGKVLVLSHQVAEIVESFCFRVLSRLVALGGAWCRLDKEGLHQLLAELNIERDQLASVMQVDLPKGTDPQQMVRQAYEQMSREAELALTDPASDDSAAIDVLREARTLVADAQQCLMSLGAAPRPEVVAQAEPIGTDLLHKLARDVAKSVMRCRGQQQPLALLLVQATTPPMACHPSQAQAALAQALDRIAADAQLRYYSLDRGRVAVLAEGYDRQQALQVAKQLLDIAERGKLLVDGAVLIEKLSIGIAGVDLVSRSFDSQRLLQGALRCLVAASDSERSAIKSIEVY
jgi:HD-like signal output (HDOD) protein